MTMRSALPSPRMLRSAAVFCLAGLLSSGAFAQGTQASQHPLLEPYKSIQGHEKISLNLLRSMDAEAKSAEPLAKAYGTLRGRTTKQGGLLVELILDEATKEVREEIAQVADLVHFSERYGRATVAVRNGAQVKALAVVDAVRMIRPASPASASGVPPAQEFSGSVDSGGRRALNAESDQLPAIVDGAGVNIGILSDSFASNFVVPSLRSQDFRESSATVELTLGNAGGLDTEIDGGNEIVSLVTDTGVVFQNITKTYTVVVETDGTRVDLDWEVLAGPVLGPIEDDILYSTGDFCDTRSSITGAFGSLNVATREADADYDAACDGERVALFGFSTALPLQNVVITASSADAETISISIRDTCDDAGTSLPISDSLDVCKEGQALGGYINLVNQISGDLPPFVRIFNDSGIPPLIDEGAAMAELIHDIAPGANLAFHTAFISEANFAEGIRTLADFTPDTPDDIPFRADVIVDDVIYFAEPMFQVGLIEQAVNDVVELGDVSYFSSAGNFYNYGFFLDYVDVQGGDTEAYPPNGGDLARFPHAPDGYLPITVQPGATFIAFLQWNQPFESLNLTKGSQVDLNMYVLDSKGQSGFRDLLFSNETERISENAQGQEGVPIGDPFENVAYINDTGAAQTVYLAIDHVRGPKTHIPQVSGAPLQFRVVILPSNPTEVAITGINPEDPATGGPTMWGHATAERGISVGAVNYVEGLNDGVGFGPTPAIDAELFTSKGGTLIQYFANDGSVLPQARTTFEPDIASVDGNNTTFFPRGPQDALGILQNDFDLDGNPNFFGTSAAAPNAAAVAALLLELNRGLESGQIRAALENTARDVTGFLAAPGVDDTTGVGLIDAQAAAQYVADNFGLTTGPAAPNSRFFDFVVDSEGWNQEALPGFTSPGFAVVPQALNAIVTTAFNTLGWWKSPLFIITAVEVTTGDGALSLNGLTGDDSVMRATFEVLTDTSFKGNVPTFRMRQSSGTFEQSDVLVVTSVGSASIAPPTTLPGRKYRLYFSAPPNDSRFRLFFDLLGLDGQGLAGTLLSIASVETEGLTAGTEALVDRRLEMLTFFNNNDQGWHTVTPDVFAPVASRVGGAGLELGPATDGSQINFTYWSSPVTGITYEANRVYVATFRVRSNKPVDEKTSIPGFRLRLNEGSLQQAVYTEVQSVNASSNTPAGGEARDYFLFFEAPAELAGTPLQFAFDYLYIPGQGKDPSTVLYLDTLRVDSYVAPDDF